MGTLQTLQKSAVSSLRAYAQTRATEHLRDVATAFVDAREHFYTRDGLPDWLGSTHAYRQWTREAYDRAGVQASELSRLQAAVRYHVGNVVRERLDVQEVAELGLRQHSPRERAVEKRERASETLSLFGGGPAITDPDDVHAALAAIDVALRRIAESAVRRDDADKLGDILARAELLRASAVTK